MEAIRKTPQTAALLSQTGLTASTNRSDRSGWNLNFQTGQTGRSQIARNQSSKWQISSKRSLNPTKLGGYLHTCPVTYPQEISP